MQDENDEDDIVFNDMCENPVWYDFKWINHRE